MESVAAAQRVSRCRGWMNEREVAQNGPSVILELVSRSRGDQSAVSLHRLLSCVEEEFKGPMGHCGPDAIIRRSIGRASMYSVIDTEAVKTSY